MKKKLIILLGIIALAGISVYMIYNKPHKDMANVKTEVSIEASDLYQVYTQDEATANERFLGKVIEVKGSVAEIKETEQGNGQIILETGDMLAQISCELVDDKVHKIDHLQKGQEVILKGICVGMTMDIILDRCIVIE